MKKILISGSSGFVGSRVLHQWQGRAELFTFPRGSLAAADESAIRRFAETMQPDVILHLAALSDTVYCQRTRRNPGVPTLICPSGWQKLHGTPGPS